MDDLISRQAAIEALQEHRNLFCDNTPETFSKLSYAEKSRVDELDMAIATLINLPSAQPETHEERTETHGVCLDVIDRQATLDWLKNEWNGMITSLFDGIKALPSAQPEMIREIRKWINSGNRGNADYFIVEKIEEIINKYE